MADDFLNWDRDGADWPNRQASRFVEAAGFVWHVQVMGRGPVLLLLHGTGASTHSWRALAALLAERFTIVAPDLPGHGFTRPVRGSPPVDLPAMARAIGGLLGVLELQPGIAAGHSAGAAVLARMCLDRIIAPGLLIGLNAALMPFGGIAGQIFSPLARLLAQSALVPRLFAIGAGSRSAAERMIRETGSAIEPAGVDLYWRLMRNRAHVAGSLAMMAQWDLSSMPRDLRGLTQKLVLIAGSNDRTVRPDDAFEARNCTPRSRVVVLRGLGHLAHEERPAEVAKLIVELAREVWPIPA